MNLFEQLAAWAQNQWIIVAFLAAAAVLAYVSGLLDHAQKLYAKLFSGERLFKKQGLAFERVVAFRGDAHWRSSESASVLKLKRESEAAGDLGLRYPAADYLERSGVLFELGGRFDNDPNPTLDIIVSNNSGSPKRLHSYGIEVLDARYRIITGGSVTKITLEESEHYKITFPRPLRVTGVDASDNTAKTAVVPDERYGGKGSMYIGDVESDDAVCFYEWEWADTPVISTCDFADPPEVGENEAYRFTLEIEHSERMPTDTLLRVLIRTNDGEYKSDRIYFLKP